MLYDKKWDAKTRPADLSLEGLIAWLERQPGDGSYNWMDCFGRCLIDLYGSSIEHRRNGRRRQLSADLPALVEIFGKDGPNGKSPYHTIAGGTPWTFGAALERARKTLAAR